MFQAKVVETMKTQSYFKRYLPENRVVFCFDGSCLVEKGPVEHEDIDINKAIYRQNKFGPSYVAQHATYI
jgi:hypothetical protein